MRDTSRGTTAPDDATDAILAAIDARLQEQMEGCENAIKVALDLNSEDRLRGRIDGLSVARHIIAKARGLAYDWVDK